MRPEVSRRFDDVWVLGAGFSRAVSKHMPLMNDLGAALAVESESLRRDTELVHRFHALGDNFEHLLTYLSADQPWLSKQQNLINRAQFLQLSARLAVVLGEAQNKAMSAPPPDWLVQLVEHWRLRRVAVLTFNYDTLVEKAYTDAADGRSHSVLYNPPVLSIDSRHGAVLGADPDDDAFWLLKLHGSLN